MKRDKKIDIIKGLAILLMVMAHAGFPYTKWINLFHVPVFFMVAGYCFSDNYSESFSGVVQLVKRRLKSLYVPYVASNLILLFLHNLLVKWNIYSNDPLFAESSITGSAWGLIGNYTWSEFWYRFILIVGFVGGEQLEGAVWFLRVLFEVTIGYGCIDFVVRKIGKYRYIMEGMIAAGLLGLGFFFSIKRIRIIGGIDIACSCLVLFYAGKVLREREGWKKIPLWVMIIGSTVGLWLNTYFGFVSIATNQYTTPVFLVVSSFLGWLLLWGIARILTALPGWRFWEYMGEKTIYILLLHFISFKLVTYIYMKLSRNPSWLLASFPVLLIPGFWIYYVACGILLPLGIARTAELIRSCFKSKKG